MGSMLRTRTGLVAVFAIVIAGMFAPSALANTPLTISKTATAHRTGSFEWTIDKSVNKSAIELKDGESATATYTVAVTKSAGTEAMWVDGEVCVSNDAAAPPTEGLEVTDRIVAFHANGTRTLVKLTPIDLSAKPVLGPGESYCYPYSFPIEPFPTATGYANEARATITNDPRGPEPVGPSTEAAFTIPAPPTVTNDSVNVDDTNGMTWLFSAGGSKTYTKTFRCSDKGTHTNTAKIRETGQSDSATVTVTCKKKDDDCPKGHDGKDKDHNYGGYGYRGNDRDDDRYRGNSQRGKDDDRCDGHHGGGGNDDDSDDSSDDSDDSDDRDCRGDRRGWGH
jgi:hypothetical protein